MEGTAFIVPHRFREDRPSQMVFPTKPILAISCHPRKRSSMPTGQGITASPPPTDHVSPTASPLVLASPPPVASPVAADATMDGVPTVDLRPATVMFNTGHEKIHEALFRVAVTGAVVDGS